MIDRAGAGTAEADAPNATPRTGGAAYERAGVGVARGDRAVDLMRQRLASSGAPVADLLGGLRGFAAATPLPEGFREPVLVTATDGVGTKTALASALGRYDTIGQDLVAMCVDDVVCHGARPFLFLDYLAVGRVDPEMAAEVVAGLGRACASAGCALVGGETAEHPGLMEPDEFDLAGFCIGLVERGDLLDGRAAQVGDAIVGMASSGLHSNGYSLVRALVARHALDLGRPYLDVVRERLGEAAARGVAEVDRGAAAASLGDVLLEPTRIYAPAVLSLRDELATGGFALRGLAHVTGGGLPGNVARALPESVGALLEPASWPMPSVFTLLGALGEIDAAELRATFNAGIGMAAVVPAEAADDAIDILARGGIEAWRIGSVVPVTALGGRRYAERAA